MVLLWITGVFVDVARFSNFHRDGTVWHWIQINGDCIITMLCNMLSFCVPKTIMYRNNIKLRVLCSLYKKVPYVGIH